MRFHFSFSQVATSSLIQKFPEGQLMAHDPPDEAMKNNDPRLCRLEPD